MHSTQSSVDGVGPTRFVIYRVLPNVALVKLEHVENFQSARTRLLTWASISPGHYVALNSQTSKIVATVINFNGYADH